MINIRVRHLQTVQKISPEALEVNVPLGQKYFVLTHPEQPQLIYVKIIPSWLVLMVNHP
jgi:hypothetical protein